MGIEPVPIKFFNESENQKKFKKTVSNAFTYLFIEKSKS